ncbi:hypothetical protein [Desulfobacterium sp. N47]|uniref:Uncharacterized protein n=1 Tax=uncultured Desulfobacterium sp. TaxID=201089 RepID=E1YIW5_9BACT|nr:unknown protein [uncultured Desulfobacterium sp.]
MKTYWIQKQEFNNKIAGKLGQIAEVLLMDQNDKQWLKAELRTTTDKAAGGGATLKVLADYGEPTDEEYQIEIIRIDSPEED